MESFLQKICNFEINFRNQQNKTNILIYNSKKIARKKFRLFF